MERKPSVITNTSQVVSLLRLRVAQLVRMGLDGGLSALVVFPVLVFLAALAIKALTDKGVVYLNILVCCFLYLVESLRKDAAFLFLLKTNGWLLRLAEYAIIILLCNLYAFTRYPQSILYVVGDLLFAVLLVRLSRRKARWSVPDVPKLVAGFLPLKMYELKYGVRQLFLLMVTLWLGSIVASFYVPVLPLFILILPCFLLDHISYGEPVEITQSHRLLANALDRKMMGLSATIFILFLPQLIISLFHWPNWIMLVVALAAFWVALSTILFALLLRYSEDAVLFSSFSKSIRVFLFLMTAPLLPLSLYLLYHQYQTARCKLQPLLN